MIPPPAPASTSYLVRLAILGALAAAGILLYTRGTSHQLAVEARLPALARLAERHHVPLPVLVAVCVAEAHRGLVRPDADLAGDLEREMREHGSDVTTAVRELCPDPVEAAMTLDLWQRNAARWERLAR